MFEFNLKEWPVDKMVIEIFALVLRIKNIPAQ